MDHTTLVIFCVGSVSYLDVERIREEQRVESQQQNEKVCVLCELCVLCVVCCVLCVVCCVLCVVCCVCCVLCVVCWIVIFIVILNFNLINP